MFSPPDDYYITVPPLYENLEDEKYQPFPPPLSPVCAQSSEECPGTSKCADEEQKIGGLLLSQMEEEPVMQKDVPHSALDVERLVSEDGISALWNLLCNKSFKGEGHEAEDLQCLLGEVEQWGLRLYPEEPFDTLVSQLEDTCIQSLHQNIATPCALSGLGGCQDMCCASRAVIKPEPKEEGDPPDA